MRLIDKRFVTCLLALALVGLGSDVFAQDRLLYRYTNESGVKVLHHSIPPKYAQNGYEVLNESGQVIKVVPPAPTEEEAAAKEAQRQMLARYEDLKRRYSSLQDIEAAKNRRLETVETSISIIRGNISGLTSQLESIMSKAADAERAGRNVPPYLLEQVSATRAELAIAEELLNTRLDEQKEMQDKYQEDVTIFVKGQAWEQQNAARR